MLGAITPLWTAKKVNIMAVKTYSGAKPLVE